MWRHASTTDAISVDYMQERCIFCDTLMISKSIENRWELNQEFLSKQHKSEIDELSEILTDAYSTHWPIISEFEAFDTSFQCCPACGWWCVIQYIEYQAGRMPYMAYRWAAGALARNEFPDIDAPLGEIRSYLCARYERRFEIDPYRLEDVVASIFQSFNCDCHVSSKSRDGGADIFGFDQSGRAFGVQVKRHRAKIRIEQIRSFLGALTINRLPTGIFVTTSDFTNGASSLCSQERHRGVQLEYANAEKLFNMLRIAQIRDFDDATVNELALQYIAGVPGIWL